MDNMVFDNVNYMNFLTGDFPRVVEDGVDTFILFVDETNLLIALQIE